MTDGQKRDPAFVQSDTTEPDTPTSANREMVLMKCQIRLFDTLYTNLIPLYISILLKVLKPIQEVLVDVPIQSIISRNNFQLLHATPQPLQDLTPLPFQATAKERRDGFERRPDHFPLLCDVEKQN